MVASSPSFESLVAPRVQEPPPTRGEVGSTSAAINEEVMLVASQETKLKSASGNNGGESDNRKDCSPANNSMPPGVRESWRGLVGAGGNSGKSDGSSSIFYDSDGESFDSDEESGRYHDMTSQAADTHSVESKIMRDLARRTNDIDKKTKNETDELNLSVSAY